MFPTSPSRAQKLAGGQRTFPLPGLSASQKGWRPDTQSPVSSLTRVPESDPATRLLFPKLHEKPPDLRNPAD